MYFFEEGIFFQTAVPTRDSSWIVSPVMNVSDESGVLVYLKYLGVQTMHFHHLIVHHLSILFIIEKTKRKIPILLSKFYADRNWMHWFIKTEMFMTNQLTYLREHTMKIFDRSESKIDAVNFVIELFLWGLSENFEFPDYWEFFHCQDTLFSEMVHFLTNFTFHVGRTLM